MENRELITVRIEPFGGAKKRVDFSVFLAELQAVHGALVRSDKIMSNGQTTTRYEVAELSTNSPATVKLAPVSLDQKHDVAAERVDRFLSNLAAIRSGGVAPAEYDRPMLEKISEMASGVRKKRAKMTISYANCSVEINYIFERRIIKLLEQTENMFGSIEGKLEALNFHNGQNVCAVYPIAGARKIICHFSDAHRSRIKSAIDRYVVVTGMVEYQYRDEFPHRIEVRDIDPIDDSGPFPSLHELRGIAPDATDELETDEFVRRMRDGWR